MGMLQAIPSSTTSAPVGGSRSVRHEIAERTREAHERLHTHPIIGRLTATSLTVAEYQCVLRGFYSVFSSVEHMRQRAGVWPQFALRQHRDALARDTGQESVARQSVLPCIQEPPKILGLLYSLHGAQFGRSVILRSLETSLPLVPHHYFSLATEPSVWRQLVQAMEESGTVPMALDAMTAGARAAFCALDRACQEVASDQR